MKILAIVEKGDDGLYSIYTEAEIAGHSFGGFGESVEIKMSTVTVQLKFLKGTLYLLKNKFQFRLQWTPQIY